jgi:hypothetical protein
MSSPTPPDPMKTAMAQKDVNRDEAITQNNLNTVSQITPQGSLNYTTTGMNPDGTPQRLATTTLAPGEQDVYNKGLATRQNIGQIGVDQTSKIGQLLGTPVNLNNDATEARTMQLARSRLDPLLAGRRSSTETDLINRGITPGSEAYSRAMGQVGQQENDAYNQLILSGHGQSVADILAERNQPINETTALMSGSQVSNPSFVQGSPQASMAPVDYMGAVNNNYNAQVSQQNALLGGLAGIGGTALGGWARGGFAMPKFA